MKTIEIDSQTLIRHGAALGGSGSGKTTLMLTIIESALQNGIPCILLDRKGDLAGYADPERWKKLLGGVTEAEANSFLNRVHIQLYTPGQPRGRNLSLPFDLESVDDEGLSHLANNFANMLHYKETAHERGLLFEALQCLKRSGEREKGSIGRLIEFLDNPSPEYLDRIRLLPPTKKRKLLSDLVNIQSLHRILFESEGETIDFQRWTAPIRGKTPLTIISTRFLDSERLQFWVSQYLNEALKFCSKNPQPQLQAILFFDEADIYLPAVGKPSTKPPMESLLKRARSAGLSILLATQSPGDFDYKCKENILNWWVGLVKEKTALEKIKNIVGEHQIGKIPTLKTGQFIYASEGAAIFFQAKMNLMKTEQLSEEEIKTLAARGSAPT